MFATTTFAIQNTIPEGGDEWENNTKNVQGITYINFSIRVLGIDRNDNGVKKKKKSFKLWDYLEYTVWLINLYAIT